MFRANQPMVPTKILLDYGRPHGRHFYGSILNGGRPWARRQMYRLQYGPWGGQPFLRPIRRNLSWIRV